MSDTSISLIPDYLGELIPQRSQMSGLPYLLPVAAAPIQFPTIVPPTFAGSVAVTTTAPSNAVTYGLMIVRANGFLPLCAVSFAAGSTTATFGLPTASLLMPANTVSPSVAGAILLVPGDILQMTSSATGPSSDPTFQGLTCHLAARGL
jgi:hypothetical protein